MCNLYHLHMVNGVNVGYSINGRSEKYKIMVPHKVLNILSVFDAN